MATSWFFAVIWRFSERISLSLSWIRAFLLEICFRSRVSFEVALALLELTSLPVYDPDLIFESGLLIFLGLRILRNGHKSAAQEHKPGQQNRYDPGASCHCFSAGSLSAWS